MAKEILVVPEEHLREVIAVIRAGLKHCRTTHVVSAQLNKWCRDEERYLDRSQK